MNKLSRTALEAIIKSIPAGVVVIEKDLGKVSYVNDRAIQIYGVDPRAPDLPDGIAQLVKPLTLKGDVYPPEQLPANRALLTGKAAKDTFIIQRPDGSKIVVSSSAVPLRNEMGEVFAAVGIFDDVTEHKQAEEALTKNEARYRSYIEVTGQLGWTTNPEGQVIEDMPSWRNFTGQTYDEIKGSGWSKALHPGDLENTLTIWRQATQEKGKYETEYRIRRKDGTYRLFMARGVPVFGTDGTIREWVGTCIDITDRKNAENILREQALVISSVSDAIFSTDASFVIKSWNKAAESIFGWSAAEAIGKPSTELFNAKYPTLDGTTREQALEQIMKKGFWKGEIIYQRKDGSPIPVSASASLVKKNSAAVGMVAVLHDVSTRMKREEVLKENRNDLNRAQAVAKTGSWRMDVQNNILLWSDENHKIFGVPKGTPLTYETFLSAVHPLDREYVDKKWKAALLGEPYDVEHRIIADGKVKWVREKVELEVDKDGILLGGFGTTQEITDLVEMREKLEFYSKNLEKLVEEKTKQLKDSERLAGIGATAGMVGHDIRNPLQAITCDVYLAKSDLSAMPEGEEKQNLQESLTSIEKNVEYINKIVQDLQDYARPLSPVPKEIDLETVFDDVLVKKAIPKGIKVTRKVEAGAEKVVGDSDMLKRILENLTNNAVQAMPNGGKLTVRASREEKDLVITVEDTGVGIPEDTKSRLFTPLFTTKSKGQGFGLVVVKRMTEALGGTITFESEVGKGTKFIVRLPPKEINGKWVFK
jgi:PAS domain S-box-containing protein